MRHKRDKEMNKNGTWVVCYVISLLKIIEAVVVLRIFFFCQLVKRYPFECS